MLHAELLDPRVVEDHLLHGSPAARPHHDMTVGERRSRPASSRMRASTGRSRRDRHAAKRTAARRLSVLMWVRVEQSSPPEWLRRRTECWKPATMPGIDGHVPSRPTVIPVALVCRDETPRCPSAKPSRFSFRTLSPSSGARRLRSPEPRPSAVKAPDAPSPSLGPGEVPVGTNGCLTRPTRRETSAPLRSSRPPGDRGRRDEQQDSSGAWSQKPDAEQERDPARFFADSSLPRS